MARVVWRNQALDDLDDIITYLEQFDAKAADRYYVRLFTLGESLRDFPHRGRPAGNGERELVTVPPYVLRYRVDSDSVMILSVSHGARRPLD
ncbi:type II toxin-antitoxin system RelE/ParE family toxin [Sphingomonas sp. KR1UV-12]|uniref:Type II toxin-antitoxin system RelE/ParE family toxin n=1 Tax=Sphingomonas aurea TaxID=3063994 RepID=A0ABT9EL51_9SPHN|nr:type II toxin-antitoxin system RelE/ParE family toxin [Sphingomonas sp. KR1UV-12]MDP1027508.1 type II toxin-antitoxin system RelE/ParE family toxin [Sphingomonas sp. KR1UV-12]